MERDTGATVNASLQQINLPLQTKRETDEDGVACLIEDLLAEGAL